MDIAEFIYSIAKKESIKSAIILEITLDDYDQYSVSVPIYFTNIDGRSKLRYKTVTLEINDSENLLFYMEMLLPNILYEMLNIIEIRNASDFISLNFTIHYRRAILCTFMHPLTEQITDFTVRDPLSWYRYSCLKEIATTTKMTCKLLHQLLHSPEIF